MAVVVQVRLEVESEARLGLIRLRKEAVESQVGEVEKSYYSGLWKLGNILRNLEVRLCDYDRWITERDTGEVIFEDMVFPIESRRADCEREIDEIKDEVKVFKIWWNRKWLVLRAEAFKLKRELRRLEADVDGYRHWGLL